MKVIAKLLMGLTDFYCLNSNREKFVVAYTTEGDVPDGWYEYVAANEKPTLKDGEVMAYHIYVKDGRLERERIAVTAEEAQKRKYQVPRVFSKLKAVAVLMKAGYWENCKKYIEEAGLYDLYLAANEFSEDNGYFLQGRAKIQEELGLDDDAVETLLAQCVKDGQGA